MLSLNAFENFRSAAKCLKSDYGAHKQHTTSSTRRRRHHVCLCALFKCRRKRNASRAPLEFIRSARATQCDYAIPPVVLLNKTRERPPRKTANCAQERGNAENPSLIPVCELRVAPSISGRCELGRTMRILPLSLLCTYATHPGIHHTCECIGLVYAHGGSHALNLRCAMVWRCSHKSYQTARNNSCTEHR